MYLADHNRYPPLYGDAGGPPSFETWAQKLYRYAPLSCTNRSWHCPTYISSGGLVELVPPSGWGGRLVNWTSYAYNAFGMGGMRGWPNLGLGQFAPRSPGEQEVQAPSEMYTVADATFTVETAWANAGVAPLYAGGFWSFTLKDGKGGIISAQVDESFDLRNLKVGPPDQAPIERIQSRFTIALRLADPRGAHAPPTKPGAYDVFVSVGQRDGTPLIALPLRGQNGQRRYKLGQIRLGERPEGR